MANTVHKHGHKTSTYRSPTYHSWAMMKTRCNNPGAINYKYYGGRGITVCDRWDKFINFLEDMGERPENLTLDRIDNNGGYSPDNCRWATKVQQQRDNRSGGKLNVGEEWLIIKLLREWYQPHIRARSMAAISRMFNITRSSVWRIYHRKVVCDRF